MTPGRGEYAINLIPLRPGVPAADFSQFSLQVDQPTCLAQDVVLGFDVYAVTRTTDNALTVDFVEVMHLRAWDEWEAVRDNAEEMRPVAEGFERLVDPRAVRTVFATKLDRTLGARAQ